MVFQFSILILGLCYVNRNFDPQLGSAYDPIDLLSDEKTEKFQQIINKKKKKKKGNNWLSIFYFSSFFYFL
jgi:hypothetical protein